MRVIYILSPTKPFGGAARSLLNTITLLKQASVEALVVMPDKGEMCSRLDELGVEYKVLDYRFGVYPPVQSFSDWILFLPRLIGRIALNHRAAREVCAIARLFKPDLIHTNVGVVTVGYIAARRLHLPHVWHIREYGDHSYNFRFYPSNEAHLRALQQSYTICISRDLARYNGLEGNERSRVIYNGVVPAKEEADNTATKRENSFLFIGRIERGKGIKEMLEAFVRSLSAMQTKHRLLLAGSVTDRQYFDELTQIITQAQAGKEIVFLGEIGRPEEYIRKAKAVIVPTQYEGFGRVMPEAMCLGTPVIAYNNAGSKEQMDNGVRLTGQKIALSYTTADELVERLVEVADNGLQLLLPMIARARQTVSTLYTNEQNAQQVLAFYNDILNNTSKTKK